MKMMDKLMNIFGMATVEEEVEEIEEEVFEEEKREPAYRPQSAPKKQSQKVVNIHQGSHMKVMVVKPSQFEDATEITVHLKHRKPVIVNLETVDHDTAKRIIDFLSGSVFALEGHIEKISNVIFVMTPHNIDIGGHVQDAMRTADGLFPWEF